MVFFFSQHSSLRAYTVVDSLWNEVVPIPEQIEPTQQYLTYEQMNLINFFRKNLLDLAVWSRAYAIARKFNVPNQDALFERLLRVPVDGYEVIRTYLGNPAAQRQLDLITKQIITFRELIDAMITNDAQKATDNLAAWYQTSDELADFFASLNPYWDREQWRNLLNQYIQIFYNEVMSIAQGDYRREITIFDYLTDQTTLIADYFSRGIMHRLQFAAPLESALSQ